MGQQHRQPNDENLLVALGRVLQTMREEENADVLIETVLDYLQSEFDYRLIWIGLYDRLDHRLFGKGGFTPDGDTTFLKQRFNLNPGDILEQVVIQQRPVGVSDLRQEVRAGEWRRVAQQYEVQGALLFPLRCKDRCFGVALLGSHLWGVSPRPGEKAQLSLLLGGLAAALYQIEVDWQRSATKHPDQVMFQMLDQLLKLPSLELRLDSIVNMTQQFVASTRTSIYWYSPERRYFWHRVGNLQSIRRFGERRTGAAGITVAEANDFYQALSGGQLVAIGAGRSPLKANSTGHLLGRLRARSLLAAPIKSDSELLGFLAVEDNEARIWEEAERQYIRATAQIVALVVEREHLETTLQQSSQDSHFAAAMSNAIATATNTNTALKNCAKLLSDRLETERFMVLREAEDGQFHLLYQQQPPNRRSLTAPLTVLGETDRQRLASVAAPIVIEDWEDDVQLLPWREVLLPLGVHSALLVSLHQTLPGDNTTQTRKGLLIVAHDTPRTWNQTERNLVSVTSQQIALLLSFDDFRASTEQATVTHQQLLTGLDILWNAPPAPDQFERAWMEHLASLLECSLAAVLSWTPQTPTATITAAVVANSRFALSPVTIPVADDALIQEALITPGLCSRNVADLPAATRRWLNIPGITQVYAIALYTGELAPTGMVILAGDAGTRLSDRWRSLVETLMSQFAWLRHYRRLSAVKGSEVTDLQTLNWYKHRCLDTLHQIVAEGVSALLELESQAPAPPAKGDASSPLTNRQPLRQMRTSQLLHHLEGTLSTLTPVLRDEQWRLQPHLSPVSLTNLLRRSLSRVEPLYKQRTLKVQIHNSSQISVYGDQLKLECVLFELLLTSCCRAQPRSQLDLWCRFLDPSINSSNLPTNPKKLPLVDLSIVESEMSANLLSIESLDKRLATLSPELPSSLQLRACQEVLRTCGGDLQFYPLEAGHYWTRLILPAAKQK